MKRFGIIFLLIMALALTGCGDKSEGVTGNIVQEESLQCPDCPGCPTCPTCPTCPVCVQEEVECPTLTDNPVELELVNIDLLAPNNPNSDKETSYRYDIDFFDKITFAKLVFEPRCTEIDNELAIELDGEIIYNRIPVCKEEVSVSLNLDYLDYGWDVFHFKTDSNEEYKITNIRIEAILADGTEDVQNLGDIRFEESSNDDEKIKDLDDVTIRNYQEFIVDLDSDEIKEDMILEFEGEERDGRMLVYVNDELAYSGMIKKRRNRVSIASELLEEGDNYFTFVGGSI